MLLPVDFRREQTSAYHRVLVKRHKAARAGPRRL